MVNWIIDELLTERDYETGYPSLADAAEQLGHRVCRVKHKPFSSHPFMDEREVIDKVGVQCCPIQVHTTEKKEATVLQLVKNDHDQRT